MMEIREETMAEAWRAAIRHVFEEGRALLDDDDRKCRQVENLVITVENPATAAEGVRAMRHCRKWRYPSEEELANIVLNKEAANLYDYLYGRRIFAYRDTVNQVDEYVVPLLQQRPDTRRAWACLLDPEEDMRVEARNVLGMGLLHFRIIDKRLCITAVIRTSGFFAGWPANIFQLSKLQEHVAHLLKLPVGSLTTISLNAHIFDEDLEDIELVLGKEIFKGLPR